MLKNLFSTFVLCLLFFSTSYALPLSVVVFMDIGFKGSGSTNFYQSNAEGDQDLIIVRELAYGEESVDLTNYGLGTPNYVQSILFRPGPSPSGVGTSAGTVTFSGATIHGFIIGTPPFGPDPLLMSSNSIFGVTESLLQDGIDPDLNPTTDFITVLNPYTFLFSAAFIDGFDDFRVIIDYGDDGFTPNAFLSINLDSFTSDIGIQVGIASDVPGSGDYGEVYTITGVPLTSAIVVPEPGTLWLFCPGILCLFSFSKRWFDLKRYKTQRLQGTQRKTLRVQRPPR